MSKLSFVGIWSGYLKRKDEVKQEIKSVTLDILMVSSSKVPCSEHVFI